MRHDERKRKLSEQIKEWYRSQKRFGTYRQVAGAAGLGYSTVKDYFLGRAFPGGVSRLKLAKLTNLPILAIAAEDPAEIPLFTMQASKEVSPSPRRAGNDISEPKANYRQLLGAMEPKGMGTLLAGEPKRENEYRGEKTVANEDGHYNAYMATALTNVERTAKIGVIFISHCVASVCEEFSVSLYEPRKATDPVHNATIQDHLVYLLDREKVTTSDLVIVLCEFPSFGAGQEIEIAGNATVPLILLALDDKRGVVPSSVESRR